MYLHVFCAAPCGGNNQWRIQTAPVCGGNALERLHLVEKSKQVGYPSIYPYPSLDDAEMLKIALNTTRGQEIQKVEEEHQKNFAWEARARRAWPGMAERWTVMDYRYRQNHISNHPVFRVKTWVNHFVHFVSVLINLNQ